VLREGICETLDGIGPALEAEDHVTTICTYVWTRYRLIDKKIRLLPSFYKLKTIDDIAVSRKKRGR
jgi:hypothetical protein